MGKNGTMMIMIDGGKDRSKNEREEREKKERGP